MATPTGTIDILTVKTGGTTGRKWIRDSWARRHIAALETTVATQAQTIATLQSNYTALEARVAALEGGTTT